MCNEEVLTAIKGNVTLFNTILKNLMTYYERKRNINDIAIVKKRTVKRLKMVNNIKRWGYRRTKERVWNRSSGALNNSDKRNLLVPHDDNIELQPQVNISILQNQNINRLLNMITNGYFAYRTKSLISKSEKKVIRRDRAFFKMPNHVWNL